MVWLEVLASCPSSGTHLLGDFKQATPSSPEFIFPNCESRDGSLAFQLVLKPLGRQEKVGRILPQAPQDQLRFGLIYTLGSGMRFLFVITFHCFFCLFVFCFFIKVETVLT